MHEFVQLLELRLDGKDMLVEGRCTFKKRREESAPWSRLLGWSVELELCACHVETPEE
jgi:hypothetical protein